MEISRVRFEKKLRNRTRTENGGKVKAHNGIVESAKKWYIQLDLTSYQPDITTFRYEGANSTRWGDRPNEALTKKHAETMYKQLWNFIMMYGDYDSLLILLSMQKQCTSNYGTSL